MSKKIDKENRWSDVVKKIVSVGIGATFMTEEVLKNVLGELPLSKDMITGLLQNAKRSKEDFLRSIQGEVQKYLSKIDPSKLIDEVIGKYDIQLTTSVKFTPKKGKKDRKASTKKITKKKK